MPIQSTARSAELLALLASIAVFTGCRHDTSYTSTRKICGLDGPATVITAEYRVFGEDDLLLYPPSGGIMQHHHPELYAEYAARYSPQPDGTEDPYWYGKLDHEVVLSHPITRECAAALGKDFRLDWKASGLEPADLEVLDTYHEMPVATLFFALAADFGDNRQRMEGEWSPPHFSDRLDRWTKGLPKGRGIPPWLRALPLPLSGHRAPGDRQRHGRQLRAADGPRRGDPPSVGKKWAPSRGRGAQLLAVNLGP